MNIRLNSGLIRAFLSCAIIILVPTGGMAASITLDFDLEDFSAISVLGTYNVVVSQGNDYLVQVIVDEEDANAVLVGKNGSTLTIDLEPGSYQFDTLEARVSMPTLTSLDVIGTSFVSLSGFDVQELTVNLDGTGFVSGQSLNIQDLSVRVIGTGGVDFGDIDPIQSADVTLDGVNTTTLNMDVGATLSGVLTGLSTLRYWGTNVELQLVSSGLSTIERLGDTKGAGSSEGFEINSGLTDAWFNPSTNGQGFVIAVWEDIQTIFIAWFTFDTERPPDDAVAILGEPGHRWLTAQGFYEGDTATMDVFVTSGGVFDSPLPEVNEPVTVGTATVVWTGCNEGLLSYNLPALGLVGDIPIERVTLSLVSQCEARQ